MHGDGSFRILADIEKLPDDGIVWRAPVHKEEVVVLEARLCEAPGVVHLLVESDNGRDVVLPEVRDVGLRSVQRVPYGDKTNTTNTTSTCAIKKGLAADCRDTPLKMTPRLTYHFLFCFLDEAR